MSAAEPIVRANYGFHQSVISRPDVQARYGLVDFLFGVGTAGYMLFAWAVRRMREHW